MGNLGNKEEKATRRDNITDDRDAVTSLIPLGGHEEKKDPINNGRIFILNKYLRTLNSKIELLQNLQATKQRDDILAQLEQLQTCPSEFLDSINHLIQLYNYVNEKKYYYVDKKIVDAPNFTGYKLVRVIDDRKRLSTDCFALLQLSINSVRDSASGRELYAHELKSCEKYCTNAATPIKSWLIGPSERVSIISEKCKKQEIQFVSNYDIDFKYEFDKTVVEPNFGKPGKGCIQGIHFFLDRKTAFRYIKTGFTSVDRSRLTMCGNITSEDLVEIFDKCVDQYEKTARDRVHDIILELVC
jgi:hypothetical protein